jgi:hypothetical protein
MTETPANTRNDTTARCAAHETAHGVGISREREIAGHSMGIRPSLGSIERLCLS